MILLDTSAAILLLRGQQPPMAFINSTIGVSSVVEMELWLGVYHGGGKNEQLRVASFIEAARVFSFDCEAANQTAKVIAELRSELCRCALAFRRNDDGRRSHRQCSGRNVCPRHLYPSPERSKCTTRCGLCDRITTLLVVVCGCHFLALRTNRLSDDVCSWMAEQLFDRFQ